MVVLAIVALSCQPQEQPSKVWLHRANDIAKAQYFQDKFDGLEVDVHFVDSLNTFVVQHDFGANSDLRLEDWIASLDNRSELCYWIDFKNLDKGNMRAASKEMARLRKTYKLKNWIIVESSNYIPFAYPDLEGHEKMQAVTDEIRENIRKYKLRTISGYYFQYQFMKDSFPEMRKLIWYEQYDTVGRNNYIRLANEDNKTDVILVAVMDTIDYR